MAEEKEERSAKESPKKQKKKKSGEKRNKNEKNEQNRRKRRGKRTKICKIKTIFENQFILIISYALSYLKSKEILLPKVGGRKVVKKTTENPKWKNQLFNGEKSKIGKQPYFLNTL